MLAKVIKLHNARGGRVSAHHGVQYIFREGGEEHALEAFALEDARIEIDRRHQRIEYSDQAGRVRMTDSGPRVDVHIADADTIQAGLQLAAQKFGGEVYITGDAAFREQAARQAARLGVGVKDADLQQVVEQERAQIAVERTPSRPLRPDRQRDPPLR
ncbi:MULTISPECIES: LPD7 domain-containing protein [unclassified Thiomonas]|jgi:hypothetical protein|uniref:LPD7 domain-containing protein n=1 Tax=unclassified Thiomonas TaxID=2625466 RepID=UPI0004DBB267|nr:MULTISPECIES: LPD7 domain-containing protein [unclassified Thiomonas]CDW95049.1 hypothetical protein THICB2_620006 [Thiomonas sp. CB2]VDY03888.1 protein of unknown function [Thiomonas sp. Bio17B3]VDY08936.1 protein of unknown function [Thiomonas sp. Sup16B3]VDY12137.1 conserved protein of unknown function [Thiomonas sp. OC7]VDY18646.1 protein of unknown function [Thiomonas sp. CB2]